ncbi:MAG: glycosyltransferase [Flavobacteriaceae bacterium]|nr:glycosyltransferase [Flavobacteriaceae bacterium]
MFSTLLIAFAVVVVVNCLFYMLLGNYAFAKSSQPTLQSNIPVSVIVCSKNEAENLKNNIPLWLAQEYPNFELILVNDASVDTTLDVIEHFAEKDSRIKIVNVENNEAFWANKKYALTLGIKKAKNNHLLFTDADCKPASPLWVQQMANHFSIEKHLVLGYGAYAKANGFLNKLVRFETFMAALQYFGFAKLGLPYMGVGRNLGYTANLFYENNGFMSHMYIRSGDDDLFVNQAATKTNFAICDSPESFTISTPKKSWKSLFNQKRRHLTTATHYKLSHKIILGAFYLSNVLFWLGLILSFVFLSWKIVVALLLFRLLVQYIVVVKALKKLRENDLVYFVSVLEIVMICFQMVIFITNLFSKPKHWK